MNGNSNTAVKVDNLEKKFGSFTAVNRINFEVTKGEIFGFLGPNGAGKSTTIRMLCGILLPTSGKGEVGGFDIYHDQEHIKRHIGYMSQKFSLYDDLTVEENIDFYSGIYGIPPDKKKERKEWIISMAGLDEMVSSRTGTLPPGWKQRLALGCAVIHEPEILFLDEPTSGVDPISRQNFWDFIKEMSAKKTTVFVTTHYMSEAENCERIALIYRGTIIALGTPDELKTTYMTEDVLEIALSDPEDWISELLGIPAVREVALFGSVLHVLVTDVDSVSQSLREFFRKKNVSDVTIRGIQPSLEDVFVSLIKSYDEDKKAHESGTN